MSPFIFAAALFAAPAAQSADTLPVPHAYLEALEAGTRSRSGAPGEAYWQQQVDYRIQTELLPQELMVTGSETITYHNRSPNRLNQIWINLPQNVFAAGNPRNRQVSLTGGFTLERVVAQGAEIDVAPRRPGRSLPTVLAIALPTELAPGDAAQIEIDWHFIVPEGAFRMGREGDGLFFLAQWYPHIAVFDDVRGWSQDPYMGDGEFYLEYGDYEVEITAPEGWLVSASGVLQNPDEVLRPAAADRLRGISRDMITHVVSRADRDSGLSTAEAGADGTLTWRYVARNVRDFAWGSSAAYVWDATMAQYSNDQGLAQSAAIHTLYRPEQPNWSRAAEFARHSIEAHSFWYPYPYPQMTVDEGVIGGGMEYPMITIVGGGRTALSLYSVISHELAHMWWPMVVGSNERRHAWMDEGLASFSEDLFTPTLFPEAAGGLGSMLGYLRRAGTDSETESMRPADLYGPFGNRGLASYGKPATVFRSLRAILGKPLFDQAMRTYVRRWAFKHPTPLDLFHTYEDVSGQDLDWFFYPWLYTTRVLDQAIVGVEEGEDGITVLLEDRGEIPMPVLLQVMTAGGERLTAQFGVDVWVDGRAELDVAIEGDVTQVVIDANEDFPDVNRGDNTWTAGR
jgi:hypothetical protein